MPILKRTYLATALLFGTIAALAMPAHAELAASGEPPAAKQGWKAVTVADGVRQPWGIAWLGDGRALVTSKQGSLHILNGQKFDEVALEGMPAVFTGGQGGLLDIVLHPQDAAKPNPRVYMTVSTGTSEANRTTLVQGVFDGKKVTGILTEMSAEVDRVRHLILGIGVDVNQDATEFPPELRPLATSLKIEAGEKVCRAELATAILRELDADYARINAGEFAAVADEWEAACITIGRNVTVHAGNRRFSGRAEALDDDGALLIRTEHGHQERVTGGDVTLEK